jgi:hypothetical protein
MTWELRWGKQAEQLRSVADKTGKTPKALEDEPEIYPDVLWLWDAFWLLHRSRPIGMTVGPIPLTEIEAYIRLYQVQQVELLITAVDALDRLYLEHEAEQHRSKVKTPAGGTTKQKRGSRGT